ncbi:RNA binding, partial [Striga asiatica]
MTSSFLADGGYHQQDDDVSHGGCHNHHHEADHRNFNGEQTESTGHYPNTNSNSQPLSGQKRQFHHSNGVDCGRFVKLYVVGLPRDATEQDIAAVFGEYGHIIEIILVRDKRTGLQQEFCFVKFETVDQAERAIAAFQSHYIFPGAAIPMIVKYADGERERLGSFLHVHKLYVGCVNRQALKWEIEEIFSPFGVIEDIFIVRDEFKQNRGFAFVQFSCRDMALAAIQALNGIYVMKGCDQPLIVRFADPKKPRLGGSRPHQYPNDPSNGHMLSNEMLQMKFSPSVCKPTMAGRNKSQSFNSISESERSVECDWSEHVSPDGDLVIN